MYKTKLFLICNLTVVLLALTVIFGWFANIPVLIQIHSSLVPMQFNTALGFLISGSIGLAIYKSHYFIARKVAFLLILLGGLTLAQYALNLNLNIDEMFMKHYLTTKTSHPGRMAPNTAFCFLLLGVFYSLISVREEGQIYILNESLGVIVFSFGLVTVIGYFSGLEKAYAWGNLTQMAVHTGMGFAILGFSTVQLLWNIKTEYSFTIMGFMGVMILLLVLGLISIAFVQRLGTVSQVLYRHPFIVSNSARHIDTNLIAIHRNMKDVVLSKNEEEINNALGEVDKLSKLIIKEFDIINERYLGDKSDINEAYQAFIDWKVIRDEVVFLLKKGERLAAIKVTRGKGAQHLEQLNVAMRKMIKFAENKANEFLMETKKQRVKAIWAVSSLLVLTLIAALLILLYVIRSINEKNRMLSESYAKLLHSSKLASLGKLTASFAHEFNNPLFGVINIVDQLGGDVSPENKKKISALAKRECWRMAELIKNLRNFYRPSSGIISLTNLNRLADEALAILGVDEKRNITVIKKYDHSLPKINVVDDQIKQVVINIIQNAFESIPPHSSGAVTISSEHDDSNVILTIQDTGEGIEDDQIHELFEPFFTTKGIKGTGLGLSVSYGIVKEHKGDIEVDSQKGQGTRFKIILPINGKKNEGLQHITG